MRIRIELLFGNVVIADSSDPHETIRVVYGASQLKIKSGNHTVDEIQRALADFLHISPEVNAYVGGKLVKDKATCTVQQGRTVEFMSD